MKAKKIVALVLTCAMAATVASALAACDNDGEKPGGSTFTEDTRIWYAVGNSEKKGDLKVNNWTPNTINDELKFTRDTTKTDENVFTAQFSIYAGDGFKFVYKENADEVWSDALWPRQVGIHHFTNVEGEGENAVLKNGEDTVFTTKGGMDANNLYLAKGQDGEYKFTLKTFPGDSTKEPELTFEKVSSIEISHDMYLYGDINNYGLGGLASAYAMAEKISGDNVTWSISLEITAKDLLRDEDGNKLEVNMDGTVKPGQKPGKYAAVQVYNGILKDGKHATHYVPHDDADPDSFKTIEYADAPNKTYPEGTGKTFNLLPEGKYVISYDQKTDEVTISSKTHDMYLIGSFNSWAEADEDYKLTESADGKYWTGTLTVPEDVTADGVKLKVYNKVDGKYYPDGIGTDVKLTEPGKYALKFDVEAGTLQYEKFGYHVVGSFLNEAGDKKVNFTIKEGITPKLEATETENVYTAEYTFADVTSFVDADNASDNYAWITGGVFAIKCVYGTELCGPTDWYGMPDNNDSNVIVPTAGAYVITLTLRVENGNIVGGSTTIAPKA